MFTIDCIFIEEVLCICIYVSPTMCVGVNHDIVLSEA